MFPRISLIMVLISGLLFIIASIVNLISGNPISKFYLGIGILFTIYAAAMLLFRRKR